MRSINTCCGLTNKYGCDKLVCLFVLADEVISLDALPLVVSVN